MGDTVPNGAMLPPRIKVPPPPIGALPASPSAGGAKRPPSASPPHSAGAAKRPNLVLDTELALLGTGGARDLPFLPPRTPAACKAGRRTALHDAIVAADEPAVAAALAALAARALVDAKDELGFTPLITAAGLHANAGVSERLVRLILAHEPDTAASDLSGYTGARARGWSRACGHTAGDGLRPRAAGVRALRRWLRAP